MHNCGKCVGFRNFFRGFGLCFRGRCYAEMMAKKGRAPVRCTLSRSCQDFRAANPWTVHPGPLTWAEVDDLVNDRPLINN